MSRRRNKASIRRNGRKRRAQKFSRRTFDYAVPNTSGQFVQARPQDGIEGPPPMEPLVPSQMPFTPPPGGGKRFIEHISTFQTRLQSYWSKIYINSDEAYQDSINNATAMRRDPVIMQPLRERQLATVLMDHQVLPEDPKDPIQKKVAEELQRMILHTPRFTMFKLDLMEAIWISKYGINVVYDWETKNRIALDGTRTITTGLRVRDWIPVHGDKIRHEHESGRIGIMTSRVGWLNDNLDRFQGGIRVTDESRVQMVPMSDHWRQAFILHKHEVEDGQFYDGRSAGMIHGVGLRTRVYWPWWFKQKLLQWIMEFAERFALGIQIWYYEAGNDESERTVRKAAEEFSSENVIIFPRPIGIEKQGPGYERIEPGMGGTQFFLDMLDGYWGGMIRKMIIGQELTSGIASTGLGSNVAKEHRVTFTNIIKFDALNLADTLTEEYLKVLAEYNYPGIDWKPRLKFIVEEPDPKTLMETAQMFIELGGQVSENQLREVAKLRKPEEGEKVLGKSAEMPGQEPGQAQQEFEFGSDHVEPSDTMDRPTSATDKSKAEMEMQQYGKDPEKFGWVTIGGSPDPEKGTQHSEGQKVFIEEGGTISKGPKSLVGKNLTRIDKNVAGTEKDERREPKGEEGPVDYGQAFGQMNNYAERKFGMKFAHTADTDPEIALSRAQFMVDRLDDMSSRFSQLNSYLKKPVVTSAVQINPGTRVSLKNGRKVLGFYRSGTDGIHLPLGDDTTSPPPGYGGRVIGKDVDSAFRHELGHKIHAAIGFDNVDWQEIYHSTPNKERVSNYATKNHKEFFAESFTAYSHPEYKSGSLPGNVEVFFDRLLGKGRD